MRYKWLLPLCFGIVDAALMLWDIHNQRVIMSMGMGWDTGAPLWPYQTPDTLLLALNLPAYVFAIPITRILHLYSPIHYFVLFPAYVSWWWLAGVTIESRLWRNSHWRWPWAIIGVLCAVGFTLAGIVVLRHAAAWWWRYSRAVFTSEFIIVLRLCAPGVWSLIFAASATVITKRHWAR
ncbi:MAG: hypothetical protein ROO76_19405 [Terriglobia bacterium]|nr:hypothetical protein [Terriglobia bacterium]